MIISHLPWSVLTVRSRPNAGSNLEANRSVERSHGAAAASLRASGALPCAGRQPSASVALRLTVTADTARLSGAHPAAARPTTGDTAGSPGETPARSGPSAAGRYHVHAAALGCASYHLHEVRGHVVDGRVYAQGLHSRQLVVTARAGEHPCAEQFGELHRRCPHSSSRGVDQHALTRLHAAEELQAVVSGGENDEVGGCILKRDTPWYRVDQGGRHQCILRVATATGGET